MAAKPAGMEPATDIASYDDVPWFRKQWFVFLLILVFIPAMLIIVFTGDVYAKANRKMQQHSEASVWRYSGGGKVMIVLAGIVFIVLGILSVSG